jgi:hypothetical protein
VPYEVETISCIEDVRAEDWDALVPPNNPFLEHAYLNGLERSGSVGDRATGWVPHHVVVYDNSAPGAPLVGAMPLYLKYDSYGEFIFDWAWADGAHRAGLPYYPKLVASVPFTPVMGQRILTGQANQSDDIRGQIIEALPGIMTRLQAWSTHVLFCLPEEKERLSDAKWLPRTTQQFHWQRQEEWTSFDGFLGSLKSRKRYKIRRERRLAREHGLDLCLKSGGDLDDQDWDALWRFYLRGCHGKHSTPYLKQGFFAHLREEMSPRVLAPLAYENGRPVAGALFLHRGDTLYARYWGEDHHFDFLHFELCYYLPIEWCITHGIDHFEGGAQGEHKLARGLTPTEMHSAHVFRIPQMQEAVTGFLAREVRDVHYYMKVMTARGPFKSKSGD